MPPPLTILVIHNHYQQRGGEDSVFETECAMLRGAGHTVICYEKHNDEINSGEKRLAASGQRLEAPTAPVLGTRYQVLANTRFPKKDNPQALAPSPYHLGPSPTPTHSKPGPGAEPQHQLLTTHYSLLTKFQLFVRTIWNSSTYREITVLIREHHPDVVHCHNTFPLISPSVYWAAARQGVPVVQTLHNYRLICINPYLYRNGRICEDCLGRSPLRGVIHRCYRGSLAASFTVAAMLMIHRLLGTYRNKVTTYIALTEFGRKKFLEARLCDPAKVVVKPNAVAAGAASTEGLAANGQRLGAEDAQGSGFRVQDQRLAASGQRLGSEGAQGSGFRVKSEEQRLAAPTAQVLGTRYQVLANTATTDDGAATKRHKKPQKETSSHTEAQRHRDETASADRLAFIRVHSWFLIQLRAFLCFSWLKKLHAKQAGRACPQDMAPEEPHLNAGVAESARVQAMPSPASNDAPASSQSCQSCNPVKKTWRSLRSLRENDLTPSSPSTPRSLDSHTESQRHREETVPTADSCSFASIRGSTHEAQGQISNLKSQISNLPTVLYVGRLSPEKGVDILIAAWKLFLAQQNDQRLDRQESRNDSSATLVPSTYHLVPKALPRLHIIGDGPERNALEAVAANIHSIHFLGAMPKNQVAEHMGQASLLVFPSVWQETFGLTILEAAALGTAAIVSDIGGQASLVEDGVTGYTFRSGSAESLAETLAKALADPDRLAKMGRNAQARFLAGDCPPQRNVAALIRTYAHVCSPSEHTQENTSVRALGARTRHTQVKP